MPSKLNRFNVKAVYNAKEHSVTVTASHHFERAGYGFDINPQRHGDTLFLFVWVAPPAKM